MRLFHDRTVLLAVALAIVAVAAGGTGLYRLNTARQSLRQLSDDIPAAAWNAELVRAVGATAVSAAVAVENPSVASHARLVKDTAVLRGIVDSFAEGEDRAGLTLDLGDWAEPLEELARDALDRVSAGYRDDARTEYLLSIADTAAADGDAPALRAIVRLLAVAQAPEPDAIEWYRLAFIGALDTAPIDPTPIEALVRNMGMEADNAFSARMNTVRASLARVDVLEAARGCLARLLDSARRVAGEKTRALAARHEEADRLLGEGMGLVSASFPLFVLSVVAAVFRRRSGAARDGKPTVTDVADFSPADAVEEAARAVTQQGGRVFAEASPGLPELVRGDSRRVGEILRVLGTGARVLRVVLCEEPGTGRVILRFEGEPADALPEDSAFAALVAAVGGHAGASRRDGGVVRRWLIAPFPIVAKADPDPMLTGRSVIVEATDPSERGSLARTLEAAGAAVRVTADAGETAELLEAEPADVVVAVAGDGLTVRAAGAEAQAGETLPLTGGRRALWGAVARVAVDDGEPVLDRAFVAETFGESAVAMLGFFLESAADPVRAIAEGRISSLSATGEAAHKMAGAARTAGAKRLASVLSALERAAVAGDEADVAALRARSGRELALVEAAIAALDRA